MEILSSSKQAIFGLLKTFWQVLPNKYSIGQAIKKGLQPSLIVIDNKFLFYQKMVSK